MRLFLILISIVTICTSCEKNLIKEEFDDSPPEVFDAFWTEFDCFYGAFEAKGVNWDSLKVACGGNLNDKSSDNDLYKSICQLLDALNDGHADISAPGKTYRSWNRRDKSFFGDSDTRDGQKIHIIYNTIEYRYLNNAESKVSNRHRFLKGTISYEYISVGYLYIPTFSADYTADFVEEAANEFIDCDAVVIDIRFNGGGNTRNFQHAMNLFCTERKLYLKSRFRNGEEHNDFSGMFEHYTSPTSKGCKNKPIVVLANSFSSSSSEYFILGLKSQKEVRMIGDTTCGAFSQVHNRVLPNGWTYRIGSQVVYTPEGLLYTTEDGKYIEGNGIAPDIFVQDNLRRAIEGYDNPLDEALFQLNHYVNRDE